MSDQLVFRSKVDMWLLILLFLPAAACFTGAAQYYTAVSTRYWWLGILLAVGIVMPLWLFFSLKYFMSDTELRVRCGPFRWTIGIGEISKIAATKAAWSNPAMSLDRIRISYGQGRSVVISPEPRHEFLRQLEARMERLKN